MARYLFPMKDKMDFLKNKRNCESNFQPQSPSHNLCSTSASAHSCAQTASAELFDWALISRRRPSFAPLRPGVSVGVICVMTVQGLSYRDKWTCLHPTRRAEDMAPSRRMAFIFPHVASHLPNRSSTGCQDWCWGGFHLHPGWGSITSLFGNQSFRGCEVELADCWRCARMFTGSKAQMIFKCGASRSQLAPSYDGLAKLLALKCCFGGFKFTTAPLAFLHCMLMCTGRAAQSLAVQADLTRL